MRADYHMYYENFVWKRVLLFAAIFACLCSRLSSLLIPLLLFGFGGSRCFVCFFSLFGGCVRVKRDCWRSKLVKYQPDGNTPTPLANPRKAKHDS
jgi:hypothetical protein